MDKHTCATSFSLVLNYDDDKLHSLDNLGRCTFDEIGASDKDEISQAIVSALGVTPVYSFGRLVIGRNDDYQVYVSDMVRVTLRDLFGKEDIIVRLKKRFNLASYLLIVPYIATNSEDVNQCLSLDDDIIEFLYKTGTSMDLDYYII